MLRAPSLATVERELVTPVGLRTLSPSDPAYCPRYEGGVAQRDGAYHQGTAWPWLMGAFVEAWLRVNGETPARRAEAHARFVAPLEARLETYGLGHLCEIADGDPPHAPARVSVSGVVAGRASADAEAHRRRLTPLPVPEEGQHGKDDDHESDDIDDSVHGSSALAL